tara:strand:+ start:702 stop:917 length:216 start_codon:yes stop_codon:yes gene_type:complete
MSFTADPYPKELQELGLFKGFREQFYKELRDSKTNTEAYDKTELIHKKYYGRNKYSSFKSFNELRARNARK